MTGNLKEIVVIHDSAVKRELFAEMSSLAASNGDCSIRIEAPCGGWRNEPPTFPNAILIVTDNAMLGQSDLGLQILRGNAHAAGVVWTGGELEPNEDIIPRLVRGPRGWAFSDQEALALVRSMRDRLQMNPTLSPGPVDLAQVLTSTSERVMNASTTLLMGLSAAGLVLPNLLDGKVETEDRERILVLCRDLWQQRNAICRSALTLDSLADSAGGSTTHGIAAVAYLLLPIGPGIDSLLEDGGMTESYRLHWQRDLQGVNAESPDGSSLGTAWWAALEELTRRVDAHMLRFTAEVQGDTGFEEPSR